LNKTDVYSRIFIITDGYYGSIDNTISTLLDIYKVKKTRVFVLGAGYLPNSALLQNLADTTTTIPEIIYPDEDPTPKVLKQLKRATYPILDSALNWNNIDSKPLTISVYPTVFDGTRSVFYALWNERVSYDAIQRAELEIRTFLHNEKDSLVDIMTIPLKDDKTIFIESTPFIHQLSAKYLIQDLENRETYKHENNSFLITSLGTNYSLTSKYTSFVVVEDRTMINETVNEPKNSGPTPGFGGGGAAHFAIPSRYPDSSPVAAYYPYRSFASNLLPSFFLILLLLKL